MKILLVLVTALSVIPVVYLFAQSSGAASTGTGAVTHAVNSELAKTILDLEAKRIAAMVKKDIATLDALLADDLTYTHSAGNTDTKASFITLIKERGRYLGVDYPTKQVITLNANTVVVRGVAVIRLKDTAPYPVVFVDVWAQREGAWQMVAWQATRQAAPAPTTND